MDLQKRKIIVSEIEYWRKNQLLPEHYCIFLLNLYTEGTHQESSAAGREMNTAKRSEPGLARGKQLLLWLGGAVLLLLLTYLVTYFNGFPFPMQIAITTILVLVFYLLSILSRERQPLRSHLFFFLSSILLILGGMKLAERMQWGNAWAQLGMAAVCLFWILHGRLFRQRYLYVCGLLGGGILYALAVANHLAQSFDWWMLQLSWMPVSILMVMWGMIFAKRYPSFSFALSASGLVYGFGPEIMTFFLYADQAQTAYITLTVKLLAAALATFFTRSIWNQMLRP